MLWLARADPRSSLHRKRGLFAVLFGARPCLMLADPRLEALRRYAILLRLDGRDLPDAEHRAMAAAGYDRERRATIAAAVFAGSYA